MQYQVAGSSINYDNVTVKLLEEAISKHRLEPYLAACCGNENAALVLYQWNCKVSASFYPVLQNVEIAFRNACNRELTAYVGINWYDDPGFVALDRKFIELIGDAKRRLGRKGVSRNSVEIVAELPFGFWTTLLSRRFEHALWTPALHRVFPFISVTSITRSPRRVVADQLNYIREFRNRIAHYEPIFPRALLSDYRTLLQALRWMFPCISEWTDDTANCRGVIAGKPV